ncbi:MAG: glycerate kinase [Magnetococcales bacterium]|nr:glycerate kinase [Magnetococcales bacterium]
MLIAIAVDGFKGCLSSSAAAEVIATGLRLGFPEVRTRLIPMADGGEGTMAAMVAAMGGERRTTRVLGPDSRQVQAEFGLVDAGGIAILEMAAASGMALLEPGCLDPMGAHTWGTGQLIAAALACGVRKIILGLGGSASTDGGVGMACALGARFLDRGGRDIALGGRGLEDLVAMDVSGLDPRLRGVTFEAACDVSTPMCGPEGSAVVFAPQKGATTGQVQRLARGLERLAQIFQFHCGRDIAVIPGSGAAGGLGGGVLAFLQGTLRPGAAMVAETIQLASQLRGVDLVITGEGRLDGQTARGKAPAEVAKVAKSLGLPVIALCGVTGEGIETISNTGIDAWLAASPSPLSPEDVPRLGPERLEACARKLGLNLSRLAREGSVTREVILHDLAG